MNFLPVAIAAEEGRAALSLAGGDLLRTNIAVADLPAGAPMRLGIRAEAIRLDKDGALPAQVEVVERLGDRTHVHVRLADGSTLVAEDVGLSRAAPGDAVNLRVDAAQAHLFDADGRGYRAQAEAHQ